MSETTVVFKPLAARVLYAASHLQSLSQKIDNDPEMGPYLRSFQDAPEAIRAIAHAFAAYRIVLLDLERGDATAHVRDRGAFVVPKEIDPDGAGLKPHPRWTRRG